LETEKEKAIAETSWFPLTPKEQKAKLSYSEENYIAKNLRDNDISYYTGAGLCCYYLDPPDKLYLLLGEEKRRLRKNNIRSNESSHVLNFLGGAGKGKREKPVHTAIREFWEESGYTLSKETVDNMQNFIHLNGPVIWCSRGKYALHFYHMNHDLDIPDRFREIKIREKEVEMYYIDWISLDAIEEAINNKTDIVQVRGRGILIYDLVSSLLYDNLLDSNGLEKTLLARLKEVKQQQNPNLLFFTQN